MLYIKINKFKKISGNKYKVYFDSSEIILYEEVILKYGLLFDREITLELIDKILEENKYYEAYHLAISYIEIKLRNKKEIYKYLERKNFNENIINSVIERLEQLNVLNEKEYIRSFINDKINLTNYGPLKIKDELINMNFCESDINEYLLSFDDSIWKEKIDKIVNKKMIGSSNKSYYMFINKLKNDLYLLGYFKDDIDERLSKVEYFVGNIEKEIEKLNKKYKNDKTKIVSALLRKGYSYEEIKNKLKGDDYYE